MARWLMVIGAAFAALAVAGDAIGAHLLRVELSAQLFESYATAVRYLLTHGIAVVAIGAGLRMSALGSTCRWPACGLVVGTLLFCGGLIGWTTQQWEWARQCAPWGGTLLILGWSGLALCLMQGIFGRDP